MYVGFILEIIEGNAVVMCREIRQTLLCFSINLLIIVQLQAEAKINGETMTSLRTELEQVQQEKHDKVITMLFSKTTDLSTL